MSENVCSHNYLNKLVTNLRDNGIVNKDIIIKIINDKYIEKVRGRYVKV